MASAATRRKRCGRARTSARRARCAKRKDCSQRQADWKPSEQEWSVGEILHHLTLAEVGTGKLTTKLFKDAPRPLPSFLRPDAFAPVPAPPPGPADAPEVVYPERGKPIGELLAT